MSTQSTSSHREPAFTPRKEFRKDSRVPNTFSLLAFSGSNMVRLYSFPAVVVNSLRRFFDQQELVVAYREDVAIQLCEYVLDDKPWASPKNTRSEKLLVDVITVLTQHGFTFLSTLDYGRDSDDRIVMAFSKPDHIPPPSIVAASSAPRSSTPHTARSASPFPSSPPAQQREVFALSFASGHVLRVINPPLSSTPAILQSVRTAWPKGVVSEQRLAEGPYEFKLKGYRWFDADNFAFDSLHCILALLSSLDAHAFTLLASVSLSNRSRTKDLWIFSGPKTEDVTSLAGSSLASANESILDLRKDPTTPNPHADNHAPNANSSQHRRFVSAPAGDLAFTQSPTNGMHARSSTEKAPSRPTSPNGPSNRKLGGVLRKAPPRMHARTPSTGESAVAQEQDLPRPRPDLPAAMPADVENMTGIGAVAHPEHQTVIYETGHANSRSPSPQKHDPDQSHMNGPPRSPHTPPLLGPDVFGVGPGVFRDSASDDKGTVSDVISCEIPIEWTGHTTEGEGRVDDGKRQQPRQAAAGGAALSEPLLPGGWRRDFEEEVVPEDAAEPTSVLRTVDARAEVKYAHAQNKMSQVGIVDMMGPQPQSPYAAARKKENETETEKARREANDRECDGTGQGWVLVTITPRRPTADDEGTKIKSPVAASAAESSSTPNRAPFPPAPPGAPMSAAVKAIAIVDAVEAQPRPKSSDGAPSKLKGLKRLLSISRRAKSPISPDSPEARSPFHAATERMEEVREEGDLEREKPKERLRARFRRASRHDPSKETVNIPTSG